MKRFPLDSLLSYRQGVEEELKEELAAIEERLSLEVGKLKRYRTERDRWQVELGSLEGKDFSPPHVELYQNYLEQLTQKIRRQEELIAQIQVAREAKRQGLLKASRDKKMVERLKEGFQRRVDLEEKQEEQKFLGDLSLSNFFRRLRIEESMP